MPRLFVGNLSHGTSAVELQQWIESRGFQVENAEIIYDRITGESRGFGFVTLVENVENQTAMGALNGRQMYGRVLTVNEATPRSTKSVHRSAVHPATQEDRR